jgi:hypothetical protein
VVNDHKVCTVINGTKTYSSTLHAPNRWLIPVLRPVRNRFRSRPAVSQFENQSHSQIYNLRSLFVHDLSGKSNRHRKTERHGIGAPADNDIPGSARQSSPPRTLPHDIPAVSWFPRNGIDQKPKCTFHWTSPAVHADPAEWSASEKLGHTLPDPRSSDHDEKSLLILKVDFSIMKRRFICWGKGGINGQNKFL